MFCPNCATRNEEGHYFCRSCGLKLDTIAVELAAQQPSAEAAEVLRRKNLFERLSKLSISISGLVGFMIIVSIAVFYKLILFGPEILFGSAMGAVVFFALLAAFFYAYPRFFMTSEERRSTPAEPEERKELTVPTGKLLNEPHFEPASVTEDSTELLHIPPRR